MPMRPDFGVTRVEEDARHEHRRDRRCEQRLHELQVGVELALAEVLQERNPRHAEHDDARRGDAAHGHQVLLARLRPQALVEIHREQRGGRVEQRGERAHQRGEHAGKHEAAEAHRQEVRHENRKRALRIRSDRLEARRTLLAQRHGNHARQQEDEHRRQLEIAGEHRAAARFLQIPRA